MADKKEPRGAKKPRASAASRAASTAPVDVTTPAPMVPPLHKMVSPSRAASNYEVAQAEEDIDEVLRKADNLKGSTGRCYGDGVLAGIRWVLGLTDDDPVEEWDER